MIVLKTPEAPATPKQLWLLHILTKEDTRQLNLTMQQASDRIAELKQTTKGLLINPHVTAKPSKSQLPKGWHYSVMYGYPPPNHHWSNGLWRWKSCMETSNLGKAVARFKELKQSPFFNSHAIVVIECKAVALARRMLQKGLTEAMFARVLKDSRND